jgi:hypothetical protein
MIISICEMAEVFGKAQGSTKISKEFPTGLSSGSWYLHEPGPDPHLAATALPA